MSQELLGSAPRQNLSSSGCGLWGLNGRFLLGVIFTLIFL